MFPWRNAQTIQPYAMGDKIRSGDSTGKIVSVDEASGHIGVIWSDGDGGVIVYPLEVEFSTKVMPWE